ncbi:MAG: adenosylmethionine--8-amino-7-oxononanoate transaminase [Proteobacteria bacterium]|nr:adenosylmethionine--8-amino-7-oxononanoate transaminase [Pseudomonadota bacterium]
MIYFITGTGTGVGKTVVSAVLARGLTEISHTSSDKAPTETIYFKPIQTGAENEDATFVQNFATVKHIPSLYHFPLAASPDQAQKESQKDEINIDVIIEHLSQLHHRHSSVICEGAGGLYVPLNQANHTWLDILTAIDTRIIVVASSQLGTLNHTTLTLRALEAHGLKELCVILSGKDHPANHQSLKRMHPSTLILSLPFLKLAGRQDASFVKQAHTISEMVTKEHDQHSHKEQHADNLTCKWDHSYCWHPYTQHHNSVKPHCVRSAKGIWWQLAHGKKVMDGISSWWVSILGHGREEIARVLANQQQRLDHVLYGGTSHKEASLLAYRLIEINKAPKNGYKPFDKVFFSDNGSTSTEVALKMAYIYSKKHRDMDNSATWLPLSLKRGYHGDTLGAMNVSAASGFHHLFTAMLTGSLQITPHLCHASAHTNTETSLQESLAVLANTIEKHHKKIYAMICEPLLQGAGGMLMQNREWAYELTQLCRNYDIPVIFDEVFTGYGRLGTPFAWQTLGFHPDILCTSKGLTAGTLPLAVTLAHKKFFTSFYSAKKDDALAHGHTFTANPLGCRVANCVLDIIEAEELFFRAQTLEQTFHTFLNHHNQLSSDVSLVSGRTMGSVLAFELNHPLIDGYTLAQRCTEQAFKAGLFIRPLQQTIYLAPALNILPSDLKQMCDILSHSILKSAT